MFGQTLSHKRTNNFTQTVFMHNCCSYLSRNLRFSLQLLQTQHTANWSPTRLTFARASQIRSYNMAATTASSNTLAEKLKALNISYPLPNYPNCHPDVNPVDIYRAHLTNIMAEVTGVDTSIVYPALQWVQTLDMGDLVLAVPALRVKGKKPDVLAAEWAAKVRQLPFSICILLIVIVP